MASVKTAISIQKSLFDKVEVIARELKISRSRLFTLAIEKFLIDYYDRQLFESINRAYEDEETNPDESEQKRLEHMRRIHRYIVEHKW